MHQSCNSTSAQIAKLLGDMVDDIDCPNSKCARNSSLLNREQLIFVFKNGFHALNDGEYNVFFQIAEMSELTLRDLATAILTHTLPHVNSTQSLFNLFQKKDIRSRVLFCGINLSLISLCLQHVLENLSAGMQSPQCVFAKLFGGFRYGCVSLNLFFGQPHMSVCF